AESFRTRARWWSSPQPEVSTLWLLARATRRARLGRGSDWWRSRSGRRTTPTPRRKGRATPRAARVMRSSLVRRQLDDEPSAPGGTLFHAHVAAVRSSVLGHEREAEARALDGLLASARPS